jgi:hypothetical protein
MVAMTAALASDKVVAFRSFGPRRDVPRQPADYLESSVEAYLGERSAGGAIRLPPGAEARPPSNRRPIRSGIARKRPVTQV